ncbi:hypothetical protein ACR79M_15110 [Sphingobacterium spiritivorum]|uniref:hypothetical protein n=1 Tax=Sphingobacterium spiritivorum TaxID=258 RepID=UPI003DA222E0
MDKLINNKQFSLKWRDVLIGALIAAFSGAFTVALETLNSGSLEFNWKAIATTAISALLAYLGKNFFEPSKTVVVKKD